MERTLVILLIVAYFAICVIIAVLLDRRSRSRDISAKQYASGANTMGVFAVIALAGGNVIGGHYAVGIAGSTVSIGFSYLWPVIGYAVGWGLAILYLPFYRSMCYKYGAVSLGEMCGAIFGKRVKIVAAVMVLVAFCGGISGSTVATATMISNITGVNYTAIFVIVLIFFTLLGILGGMGALSRLNCIHFIAITVGLAVLLIMVCTQLGDGQFHEIMTMKKADGTGTFFGGVYANIDILAIMIMNPLVAMVSALAIAGSVGAKNFKTSVIGQAGVSAFGFYFFFVVTFIGIIGCATLGIAGDNNSWYNIAAHFGPLPTAIAAIVVLAADLSSAPAIVLLMGSGLIRDIYEPITKKKLESGKEKRLIIIWAIIFGIVSQALGYLSNDLVAIVSNAYTVWGLCGLVLAIFFIWKRPNEKAVFWSILIGTIVCAIWVFSAFFIEGTLLGISVQNVALISCALTLIIVTFCTTKRGPSDSYKLYKEARQALKQAKREGRELESYQGEVITYDDLRSK